MGGVDDSDHLGLGARIRWNYAETERVDEIDRWVDELSEMDRR